MNKNYDFKFKILLLGDSYSGKTCLLKKYVDNVFEKKYFCTIGVDFKTKLINVGKYKIVLQIWDAAGQKDLEILLENIIKEWMDLFLILMLQMKIL